MSIKRERLSIIIALVGLFGLAVTTLLLQLSNARIASWQQDLLVGQNKLNNIYGLVNNKMAMMHYYSLLQASGRPIAPSDNGYPHLPGTASVVTDLMEEFVEGKLTPIEYIKKRKDYSAQHYYELVTEYNNHFASMERLYKAMPRAPFVSVTWDTIESMCYVLQAISIVGLLLLEVYLLRTLGKRNLTAVENKLHDREEEIACLKERLNANNPVEHDE